MTPAYLDALVELDSDPLVMRFVSDGQPTPRSAYETDLMARMCAYDGQRYGFYAAHEPGAGGEDPFVGWFHLRPSVADDTILELGYRLRRAAWGRGLATEGALALARRAFYDLDQREVDACARPDNEASIAVMRKCGMHPAGRFFHPRAPIEVVRYLVTQAEFDRLHGPA